MNCCTQTQAAGQFKNRSSASTTPPPQQEEWDDERTDEEGVEVQETFRRRCRTSTRAVNIQHNPMMNTMNVIRTQLEHMSSIMQVKLTSMNEMMEMVSQHQKRLEQEMQN